jgi:hypothetical protein
LVALLLVLWFITEIDILLLLAPNLILAPFDEGEEIKPEAREYNTRALTLAGLTFAAIGLIYGTATNPSLVAEALTVLVTSLSFFLVSYSLEALVRFRRLYWISQDKSLAFGYISMFAGVLVLFYERLPAAFAAGAIGLVIVSLLHLREFAGDIRHWGKREKAKFPRAP